MAEKTLRLKIITPDEVKLDDDVDMVIMRCMTGDMGILPGHEARSAILDYGVVRIYSSIADLRWLAVFGGMAEIKDDVVTILANDAVWPQDVDSAEALEIAREQAERKIKESDDDDEIQKYHAQLRRTLVEIEVSSYPVVGGRG